MAYRMQMRAAQPERERPEVTEEGLVIIQLTIPFRDGTVAVEMDP
jgi:hypothetical protein